MYHSGGNVNRRGGCEYVEAGSIWEICVLSAQFFCALQTALKYKVNFLKRAMRECMKEMGFEVSSQE